jgi:hypothetical protein
MKSIWVLKIYMAPDWPYPGGWANEGYYLTAQGALDRIEQLKTDPYFIKYELFEADVKP